LPELELANKKKVVAKVRVSHFKNKKVARVRVRQFQKIKKFPKLELDNNGSNS
jgi:hypothetical protein